MADNVVTVEHAPFLIQQAKMRKKKTKTKSIAYCYCCFVSLWQDISPALSFRLLL